MAIREHAGSDRMSAALDLGVDLPEGIDLNASRIPTKGLTREQWLAIRRTGIGSSDVAACLGEDPFGKTPFALYQEKRGEWEPDDISDKIAVEVGNDLEEYCAQKFSERTGKKVRRDNFIRRNPQFPWMIANLDRRTVADNGDVPQIVECKTSLGRMALFSDLWGEDGSADVPEYIILQVTHQMIVDGSAPAYVPALLAGPRINVYSIPLNETIADAVIEGTRDMWRRIVKGDAPPVTSLADARRAFPKSRSVECQASAEIVACVAQLRDAKGDEKSAKARIDALQGQVAGFMADADTLMHGNQRLLTYKTVERGAYSVGPSSSRQFRIDSQKEASS
jgi:putative phage-type endonuclease